MRLKKLSSMMVIVLDGIAAARPFPISWRVPAGSQKLYPWHDPAHALRVGHRNDILGTDLFW
jgi:hypothetical protein